MSRFIDRETVRLELSDGDWIEVKTALNYGESKRVLGAGLNLDIGGGGIASDLNLEAYKIQRIATWVTAWSLRNDAGAPERLTPENIARLSPETGVEIDAVLDAHILRLEAAKNVIPPG